MVTRQIRVRAVFAAQNPSGFDTRLRLAAPWFGLCITIPFVSLRLPWEVYLPLPAFSASCGDNYCFWYLITPLLYIKPRDLKSLLILKALKSHGRAQDYSQQDSV